MNSSFLANQRSKLGLSQGEIAAKLGYSVQMVSLWEKGGAVPSFPILGQYASLLQIDLEGLLFGKAKKENSYCEEHEFDGKTFGSNIRLLRKQKGWTQKELSEKIFCPVNALTRIEKGESFPSIEQFIALAGIFQKSYDELYFCVEVAAPTQEEQPVKKKRSAFLRIVLPILIAVTVLIVGAYVYVIVRDVVKNMSSSTEPTTSIKIENNRNSLII